ncbi:MAG: hypothetical protein AAEJ47_02475 [Planctomycetota bacterium]
MNKLPVIPRQHSCPRQEGMALFVVLVLVLVLTVLITQLVFVTKVEERISRNRQGYVSLSYALQSVARQVLQNLSTDLMEDLGYFEEDELLDDALALVGGGGAGGGFGGGSGALGTGLDTGGGPNSGQGATENNSGAQDRVDTRHDSWAYPLQDSINEVQLAGQIIDGESCIDLNHIFDLAEFSDEEDPDEGEDELDEEALAAAEAAGIEGLLDGEELIDEYVAPDQETVDEAEIILQRLIEAVIDYNMEYGFDYYDVPDSAAAAGSIVAMVYHRSMEEETRRIRSLDSIRNLEGINWELFNGPVDPELDEEDQQQQDEFEDSIFDMISSEAPGAMDVLEQAGFELFDEGVSAVPTPIGLRHVLTANSSGKINLNTARPEVLIALLQSFEDFDEAKEIAWMIYDHGNQYEIEDEEDGADPSVGGVEYDEFGVAEEETQPFQHFTNFDQLRNVNEEWVDSSGTEESIFDLLKQDLEDHTVFSSNYFTATIEGTREDRVLSGRIVCARKDHHIVVLSWREVRR